MALYEFEGKKPQVPSDSFVHPTAVLIGDVRLGHECLIAPGVSIRADFGPVIIGDNVKIKEGEKERIQVFAGTVLARDGSGSTETFTVRRIATNGIGVERTFLLRSPRIDKVVVERRNKVNRARLYFLRKRTGKGARLKQKFN